VKYGDGDTSLYYRHLTLYICCSSNNKVQYQDHGSNFQGKQELKKIPWMSSKSL